MTEPFISAVITVHGPYLKYLGACIESVRVQTRPFDEIIVIEDLVPGTPLKKDLPEYPGVRYKSGHFGGSYAPRNCGVALAKGEYIAFIDADDWIDPRFNRLMSEPLQNDAETGLVYCGHRYEVESGSEKWFTYREAEVPEFSWPRFLYENFFASECMVRRDAWPSGLKHPGEPIGNEKYYGEDWETWLCLLKEGWRARAVKEKLIHYRIHGANKTAPVMENVSLRLALRERISARYLPYDISVVHFSTGASFGYDSFYRTLPEAHRARRIQGLLVRPEGTVNETPPGIFTHTIEAPRGVLKSRETCLKLWKSIVQSATAPEVVFWDGSAGSGELESGISALERQILKWGTAFACRVTRKELILWTEQANEEHFRVLMKWGGIHRPYEALWLPRSALELKLRWALCFLKSVPSFFTLKPALFLSHLKELTRSFEIEAQFRERDSVMRAEVSMVMPRDALLVELKQDALGPPDESRRLKSAACPECPVIYVRTGGVNGFTKWLRRLTGLLGTTQVWQWEGPVYAVADRFFLNRFCAWAQSPQYRHALGYLKTAQKIGPLNACGRGTQTAEPRFPNIACLPILGEFAAGGVFEDVRHVDWNAYDKFLREWDKPLFICIPEGDVESKLPKAGAEQREGLWVFTYKNDDELLRGLSVWCAGLYPGFSEDFIPGWVTKRAEAGFPLLCDSEALSLPQSKEKKEILSSSQAGLRRVMTFPSAVFRRTEEIKVSGPGDCAPLSPGKMTHTR